MGISSALVAFLQALDGSRTEPGHAPAAPAPPPVQGSPALIEQLGVLSVKVAHLEASMDGLRGFMKEETDRATRASEASRRAVQRALHRLEGSGELAEPADDVSGDDGSGRAFQPVQPMFGRVEAAPIQPTPEQIREAARRALS